MDRIVEILVYRLKPATGVEFFNLMRDLSVPLHGEHGIDVVWHGQSLHDADAYCLIRAFSDMETLEASQAAFYMSEAWRAGPREDIVARIDIAMRTVMPMSETAITELRRQSCSANTDQN